MNSFAEYFKTMYEANANAAEQREIHSCPDLIECVQQMGFLPLLESSIDGFCAEGMMAEECRFIQFPDGSWEWPLWQWKSSVLENGNCVYGKFFEKKSRIHFTRMVARLLQLASQPEPHTSEGQHRGHHTGHAARKRQYDNQRLARRMWIYRP